MELFEIQSDNLEKVSINKAMQAFEILKKPLVVDDSGFFIPSGYDKTLSRFLPEEREERSLKRKGVTAFTRFAEWIVPNAESKL